MKQFLTVVFLGVLGVVSAQEKKSVSPTRIQERIKIDANFDELAWSSANLCSDFIQLETQPGEASAMRTEVKVLYDDHAIYIGARLFDTSPDSIGTQYTLRDETSRATDWFGVVFDCYRDGNNGAGFTVTAVGVQRDVKFSSGYNGDGEESEDRSWNAVWDSETRITADGWVVEMKIPYAAIRFPEVEMQTWHVNFRRYIARYRETSYWNELEPSVAGTLNQSGLMMGLTNLRTPVRLQAMPYVSAYAENYREAGTSTWGRQVNGGMDIKYGINDAFTLDMTLVPDFGQVQFDKRILNLDPFEVRFDEYRQFFTEGVELFNKGNLFYSRRVGGTPKGYFSVESNLADGETIVENPATTQLYNASKVSGRLSSGMGLGFFNAVAAPTYATIRKADGDEYRVQTSPLSNYNVMSVDQNLPNNGFVTLVNTNVWRSGGDYDANVTGLNWQLRNKKNMFEVSGQGALHQKFFTDFTDYGGKFNLGLSKVSGNFQGGVVYNYESRDYDPNDLGFLFSPNERSVNSWVSYTIFKPFGAFNRMNTEVYNEYVRLASPNVFTDFAIGGNFFMLTRKIFAFGGNFRYEPIETYDYFEPRTGDFSRFFTWPTSIGAGGFISTDYRRAVALDVRVFYRNFDDPGNRQYLELNVSPRFRPSDKLFILLRSNVNRPYQTQGYAYGGPRAEAIGYDQISPDDIIFSRRNQITVNNEVSGQYTFNNKMGLVLRLRHYWTNFQSTSFHLLTPKGYLAPTPYTGIAADGTHLHDANADFFNIDLVYSWRFAPGSDLSIVWKNIIQGQNYRTDVTYFDNLKNLNDNPTTNSLSFKLIYFLDYATIAKG